MSFKKNMFFNSKSYLISSKFAEQKNKNRYATFLNKSEREIKWNEQGKKMKPSGEEKNETIKRRTDPSKT